MNAYLNSQEYEQYLKHLIDSIFQILPLFEEDNPYLKEYIDSLLEFEIKGATALQDMKKEHWYPVILSTLTSIHFKLQNNEQIQHRQMRREILKMTNLIDKHRRKGGE